MKKFLLLVSVLLACAVFLGGCSQTAPQPAPPVTAEPLPAPGKSPAMPTIPSVPVGAVPATASLTPAVTQPSGTPNPAFLVDVNVPGKAFQGTTLFADNHDTSKPRIVEVNMLGEVTWEYRPDRGTEEFHEPRRGCRIPPERECPRPLPQVRGVPDSRREGRSPGSTWTRRSPTTRTGSRTGTPSSPSGRLTR